MEKFSTEQRTKILEFYFENHRSITLTQRAYRQHFNVRQSPSQTTIDRFVARWRQQGVVSDLPRVDRPRSVRTAENIGLVRDSIDENSETSTRRSETQIGMARRSLQRILGNELHLFPYKVQLVQALKPRDSQSRLAYAVRIQELAREQNEFIHKLIMSDEAHFHLNGFVNKQNCRIWASENPRVIHQRELHPIKCTVWCGVTSERVIGPYFFENEEGVAVTVNGERYRELIDHFLRPAVEDNPEL